MDTAGLTIAPLEGYRRLLDAFLAQLDVSASSRATYAMGLRQFFVWCQNRAIINPTRETVIAYKESLDARGLRPYTRAAYLVAVRRFFEWVESTGLYPNIAKGVKGPKKYLKVHQRHALTIEQCKLLLSRLESQKSSLQGARDYALINILIRTGLRLIEITRANIQDLDFAGDTDDGVLLWVRGKGRAGKDDSVLVTGSALTALQTYIKLREPKSSQEPLFASLSPRNYGQRLTVFTFSRLIKKYLKSIGIDSRRISAHSLRHTFGVLSIQAGASLYEVQLAMRHTAPTTTEIYLGDIERSKRLEAAPEKMLKKLLREKGLE